MSSTLLDRPDPAVTSLIHELRGHKVMLDSDLAKLYAVETKVLNQAVKRNHDRFPEDFMFQLSADEADALRSQIVTSKPGGRRYLPYAFTEQGIAMLSSVLKSRRASTSTSRSCARSCGFGSLPRAMRSSRCGSRD